MSAKFDLAECAQRELTFRRAVYPKLVRAGKMKQAEADRQIALMHKIYRLIVALPDEEIEKTGETHHD